MKHMLVPNFGQIRDFELPISNAIRDSIISTLAYSAVFNYPLTLSEIQMFHSLPKYLIGGFSVENELHQLVSDKKICNSGKYYYLSGFESGVEQRLKRKKIAENKLTIASGFIAIAKKIPTIKLIGISGALAMENAHKEDDIDLFIVTASGTVWITRMLCILLAESLGLRRRPKDVNVEDKLCLNMFVDEDHLAVPEQERDLFSAHEVVQMKPVYNKEYTYESFLVENSWVREYLPNINIKVAPSTSFRLTMKHKKRPSLVSLLFHSLPIENVSRFFQQTYMRGRVTNEVLGDGYLRFHPSDARHFILIRHKQILQNPVIL